ncbi:MAG: DNA-3-methyladenine glycosylase I [Anaerovoracaceae bacterium]|jgi:DNA-3-methyladenine glycosylase I
MSWCGWRDKNEYSREYHDNEWGMPLHDDRLQFEFLMMEALQCGLNWNMMLRKRDVFRECFDDFDFEKVAQYDESDIERIMGTEGMIRSRRKIEAVINNAGCYCDIRKEYGSFSEYLWSWSGGKTILYNGHGEGKMPVSNGLSERIAADLKKRGFRFLGPVTVYSHLQACGIINDHSLDCPCYKKINENYPTVKKRRDREKY